MGEQRLHYASRAYSHVVSVVRLWTSTQTGPPLCEGQAVGTVVGAGGEGGKGEGSFLRLLVLRLCVLIWDAGPSSP